MRLSGQTQNFLRRDFKQKKKKKKNDSLPLMKFCAHKIFAFVV